MRRAWVGLLFAVAALTASSVLAVSAAAEESCPYARHLVDCRNYQLVNLPDTHGAVIPPPAISPAGDRVWYTAPQAPSSGATASFLASRTASGWSVRDMMPPAADLYFTGEYGRVAWSRDLTAFFMSAHPGVLAPGFPADLLRLDGLGGQELLARFPVGGSGYLLTAGGGVASDDGRHLYAASQEPFDPGQVVGQEYVYDFGTGTPALVSRLPDDSIPLCGAQFLGRSTIGQRWTSSDGMRVFFVSQGDGACGVDPAQLYVRDRAANGGAGASTEISGPAVAGPDATPTFIQASEDGSQVIYTTTAQLVAGDTNAHRDIYRFTLGAGNECLTCGVSGGDANVAGEYVAASEDLSHVYFLSKNALAPGATAKKSNLYVWHADPENPGSYRIDYVMPGSGSNIANNPTLTPTQSAELTPDGNVLVFGAPNARLDAVSGSTGGGHFEYYRYDDRDKSITCISCPTGQAATVDAVEPLVQANSVVSDVRAMSDDGRIVLFRTAERLVPQDVDGTVDIYEWHDGRVSLISDGVTPHAPIAADQIRGVSRSGDDVFIESYTGLVPEAFDGGSQLYDARVDAAPASPANPSVGCSPAECQNVSGPPPLMAPASSSFTGEGQVNPGPAGKSSPSKAQRLNRALKRCARFHGRRRKKCQTAARRRFGKASKLGRGK